MAQIEDNSVAFFQAMQATGVLNNYGLRELARLASVSRFANYVANHVKNDVAATSTEISIVYERILQTAEALKRAGGFEVVNVIFTIFNHGHEETITSPQNRAERMARRLQQYMRIHPLGDNIRVTLQQYSPNPIQPFLFPIQTMHHGNITQTINGWVIKQANFRGSVMVTCEFATEHSYLSVEIDPRGNMGFTGDHVDSVFLAKATAAIQLLSSDVATFISSLAKLAPGGGSPKTKPRVPAKPSKAKASKRTSSKKTKAVPAKSGKPRAPRKSQQ